MKELFEKLSKPFDEQDIQWRVSRSGVSNNKPWAFVLAYIDARAIMNRLDEVVGIDAWKDEYRKEGDAIICRISIKLNNEWVYKEDAADETDIEAVKGGFSGAFKRAAVKWGMARYLYNLTENYAEIVDKGVKGAQYAKTKEGATFYWLPPKLPSWALPEQEKQPIPPDAKDEEIFGTLVDRINNVKSIEELFNLWTKEIVKLNLPEYSMEVLRGLKDKKKSEFNQGPAQ